MTKHGFTDLATAAYCPRKLYYRRRAGGSEAPHTVRARRDLAFRYGALLADPDRLVDEPIAVDHDAWRDNLERATERDWWPAVADPVGRDVFVVGRRCHGVVHKLLDLDGPAPGVVSGGVAPETGVWEPDAVRAVAAAKALAWDRATPVERAVIEYPACGVIRSVRLTTRRKATYRRALRVADTVDGPPPRLTNASKCEPCEYRDRCGVRTRSLRSLLP